MSYIAQNLSHFTQKEIQVIFKKALRVYKSPELDLLMAPAQKQDFGRILVITPRKIGNAPDRNRVRRRLKALFYQDKIYERMVDVIVFIKKDGLHLTSDQLEIPLNQGFKQFSSAHEAR